MGRGEVKVENPLEFDKPIVVAAIKLTGGYDRLGTYWGDGMPLWWFTGGDGECEGHLRQFRVDVVVEELRARFPKATPIVVSDYAL
jgi:hypothetical protein